MDSNSIYDVIIIGSGFGGAMSAWALVQAGFRVLMVERGDWVPRGEHNWGPRGSVYFTPYYSTESIIKVKNDKKGIKVGMYYNVGGPSVFYGAVSLRFREADFTPPEEIITSSGACWPISYEDLEPYYTQAENLLNIAGETGNDPTEPYRSTPYPQKLGSLSRTSQLIGETATKMGLHPFRLPLAINYQNQEQTRCVECTTCDTFACAIGSKNDLATRIIPRLMQKGMTLKDNTVAVRLIQTDKQITAVECIDKKKNKRVTFRAKLFILSAGALASPHLILSSGLEGANPAGNLIGRYLMRHCSAIVYGFFPDAPAKENRFHKQLGIHDFYFGLPLINSSLKKLGSIQQVQTPPVNLVKEMLPPGIGSLVSKTVKFLTGLLVQAEDQPRYDNAISVDFSQKDPYGFPAMIISHQYSKRDLTARNLLIKEAKKILRKAGALFCYVHHINTFSHAVGTIRMGTDPHSSVLDEHCQFRGIHNLFIIDGSFMPTSAAVNPSLTIAANALRVGEYITKQFKG
ncbi:MAG: GMC family oxidoreductase [Calditrichaeota bacterium]|nr:MAG: GMC family oxidoreductase [Calditrichota bacterium]